MKTSRWKSAFTLQSLIIGMLVLIVAGCSGQPTTQPATQSQSSPDLTADEQSPADEQAHADEQDNTDEHDPADEQAHADEQDHADEHDHADEQDHADKSIDLSAIIPIAEGETLNVVATTSIVGDVVSNIGDSAINLTVLMPPGADPHTFEPTPQDHAAVSDADIVFANGVGLEIFMERMLQNTSSDEGKIIYVSHGIELIAFETSPDQEHALDEETEHDHDHSGFDPHVWFSPMSVEGWVDNIELALRYADPTNSDIYQNNAAAYRDELHDLDAWIKEQVAQLPKANRKLVTDHTAFGYFAHRYGFEQIGAVIPAYSTMAEPSAKELAELEDAIRKHQVPAIFAGITVNPSLSERVAQDTGVDLVSLYTGSLSEAGGDADTYLKLMRYNVEAIVGALSDG